MTQPLCPRKGCHLQNGPDLLACVAVTWSPGLRATVARPAPLGRSRASGTGPAGARPSGAQSCFLREVTSDPPGQRPESSHFRHPREQKSLGPAPRGPTSTPHMSCCDPFFPGCSNSTPSQSYAAHPPSSCKEQEPYAKPRDPGRKMVGTQGCCIKSLKSFLLFTKTAHF